MAAALFWASAAFIAYVYVGYPALLAVWSALAQRGNRLETGRFQPAQWPEVTVVIAARNEAHRLPARIDNLLACDYPKDRLRIIVASDGSTDGTAAALAEYHPVVDVLDLPPGGKAAALNAAVAQATTPVLVFADARQRFAPDAIRRLVSHFADPRVGAVSGELMIDAGDSTIGDGVGAYWSYEKWLRRHEGRLGRGVGVTGAIYAMRRQLWQPLPSDTILDDVLAPMRVAMRGYRVTFDSEARAFDVASADAAAELRRKIRTLAGNFQLVAFEPRLLWPGTNPAWLPFVSHKIARLFVPYALVVALGASAWLAPASWGYAAAFGAQLAFYALAVYGARLDRRTRPAVPATGFYREAA